VHIGYEVRELRPSSVHLGYEVHAPPNCRASAPTPASPPTSERLNSQPFDIARLKDRQAGGRSQ